MDPIVTAVKAVQDDSSHWYLIPNDEIAEWCRLWNLWYNTGDDDIIEQIGDKYDKYRTGGDLNNTQLYIEL